MSKDMHFVANLLRFIKRSRGFISEKYKASEELRNENSLTVFSRCLSDFFLFHLKFFRKNSGESIYKMIRFISGHGLYRGDRNLPSYLLGRIRFEKCEGVDRPVIYARPGPLQEYILAHEIYHLVFSIWFDDKLSSFELRTSHYEGLSDMIRDASKVWQPGEQLPSDYQISYFDELMAPMKLYDYRSKNINTADDINEALIEVQADTFAALFVSRNFLDPQWFAHMYETAFANQNDDLIDSYNNFVWAWASVIRRNPFLLYFCANSLLAGYKTGRQLPKWHELIASYDKR